MLLNFSNHPSTKWFKNQLQEAVKLYGSVADFAFPIVPPEASEKQIDCLVMEYFKKIMEYYDQSANKDHNSAVHIQGEFTFSFRLVYLLKSNDIECIASTTYRDVVESNGEKISVFRFVRFRKY